MARECNGFVEVVCGSMMLVTFIALGDRQIEPSIHENNRLSFVRALDHKFGKSIRVLHGRASGQTGAYGGESSRTHRLKASRAFQRADVRKRTCDA